VECHLEELQNCALQDKKTPGRKLRGGIKGLIQ